MSQLDASEAAKLWGHAPAAASSASVEDADSGGPNRTVQPAADMAAHAGTSGRTVPPADLGPAHSLRPNASPSKAFGSPLNAPLSMEAQEAAGGLSSLDDREVGSEISHPATSEAPPGTLQQQSRIDQPSQAQAASTSNHEGLASALAAEHIKPVNSVGSTDTNERASLGESAGMNEHVSAPAMGNSRGPIGDGKSAKTEEQIAAAGLSHMVPIHDGQLEQSDRNTVGAHMEARATSDSNAGRHAEHFSGREAEMPSAAPGLPDGDGNWTRYCFTYHPIVGRAIEFFNFHWL